MVGGKVYLKIFPRRMVRTVWDFEKPNTPFPPKNYVRFNKIYGVLP